MLTLGTGVGGGIVIDGHIERGHSGLGAEMGHVILDGETTLAATEPGFPRPGSLEWICSGTGLERAATEAAGTRVSGREAVKAAQEGDETMLTVFERYGRWLGLGIASVVNTFEPEYVVIGGGLSRASICSWTSRARRPLATRCRSCGSAPRWGSRGGRGRRRDRRGRAGRAGAGEGRYCPGDRRGSEMTTEELAINTIRTLSMDGVQKANSGHPGAPMALAPVAYRLYAHEMKHNPANPDWFDRDRFVLSAGHASMLLYSVLHLSGYGITIDDLQNFRQLGSPTPGHPEFEADGAPGVEVTTGPLGQGISNAVGLALAERMLAARYNRDGHELIDHHTYTIASDGDMQEGVASEACSLAGHLGLGRLIAFYDDNKIQLAGETKMAFSEDVGARFEAYGWHVQNLGEDLAQESVAKAITNAKRSGKPSLIILRTHIGEGSPNKQDTHSAHGSPLGEDEVRLTKEAYGWDPDAHFLVPGRGGRALPRGRGGARRRRRGGVERARRGLPRRAPRAVGRAVAGDRRPAPRRLGLRPAAVRPRRRPDRHPQGVAAGDPVGGREGPTPGERLGRPGAVHAHADR